MKSNLEELKSFKELCSSQLFDVNRSAKESAQKRFDEFNGCQKCRGRGWVVTWDTLDSMTGCYHESENCTEESCDTETRALSGLMPRNNKYDNFHGSKWQPQFTDVQISFKRTVEKQIRDIEHKIAVESARWQPSPGKVVRVIKSGRGPKARRVPVGTEGLVKKLHVNDWGTTKAIVVDADGKQWWPTITQIIVVDPEPDMNEWNKRDVQSREKTGFPIVVTVKKKTSRAVLVRTTTSKEIWIPFSQVPELRFSNERQTLSVSVPMWIAEKNGLVTRDR